MILYKHRVTEYGDITFDSTYIIIPFRVIVNR
nr:MAG TPA: hypothetical protein [Caudoviricetes sp.]